MDSILRDLGGILLRAVPTFLLVIFLHFYLKSVFFGPIQRILQKRYEATEGARKLADESLARAAQKTAEYTRQNARYMLWSVIAILVTSGASAVFQILTWVTR